MQVLAGRIGEAIAMTQQLYPGLLRNNEDLHFRLKVSQIHRGVNLFGVRRVLGPSPAEPVTDLTSSEPFQRMGYRTRACRIEFIDWFLRSYVYTGTVAER